MNLLAPLFLLGALAIALPILLHLIRRTTREKQVFSSLMFLQPTPPRITRQSRLENLLLLLLRCLVLALLAFAFSRPFLQRPTPVDPGEATARQTALLIDVSASMQREDLWAQALKRAEAVLDQAKPSDILACYTYDQQLHPQLSLEEAKKLSATERRTRLKQVLMQLKPGWGNAQLGSALIAVAESFESGTGGQRSTPGEPNHRIVLLSDLAEGSHLAGLQGHEWPKDLEIDVQPVLAKKTTNAGLQLIPMRAEEEGTTEETTLRLRVTNTPDAQREQFQIQVQAAGTNAPDALDVYIPPGQSRIVSVPVSGTQVSRFSLRGDDAPFDNTLQWFPPPRETIHLLYFGSEAESDPNRSLYYVQRAFANTRLREFKWLLRKPGEAFTPSPAAEISLILATTPPDETQVRAIRPLIEEGRTLVYVLPNAAAAQPLSNLLNLGDPKVKEAPPRNYHLLGQIDFQHPLFAPFADSRFSDFTKIHFWKHRQWLTPDLPAKSRVLATFDDESPAIVEVPLGKGSVLILTSGWAPGDSQLALSTKFVPLLYSILEASRPPRSVMAQGQVGDLVTLPPSPDGKPVTILKPDGSEAQQVGARFRGTDQPGIYTVKETGMRISISLAPEESRTNPLGLDPLERLQLPLVRKHSPTEVAQQEEQRRLMASSELENRQKLWRWLSAAGLAFVVAETWLAGRLIRPRPTAS